MHTVHPRVCGEHCPAPIAPSKNAGSSPRVRGTHCPAHDVAGVRRFIPACAGNTYPGGRGFDPRPVHPRVCGEHADAEELQQTIDGSSPRVRGTPSPPRCRSRPNRFIPACAGNTGQGHIRHEVDSVHPRVCGEHIKIKRHHRRRAGSSPRVRGTRESGTYLTRIDRFIPACAGNTSDGMDTSRSAAVHPRVCGEHFVRPPSISSSTGSSPRVRGTLV